MKSETEAEFRSMREDMVAQQITARGVEDPAVLEAMRRVPRHLFVPASMRSVAYTDSPLLIGHGQTISQPFIVAYMTEQLALRKKDKVLEIGTGSGYQAAVLAEIADSVYTIEIVAPLAERAAETLKKLGYRIQCRTGDGYLGWPEEAPFDAIIITAAPPEIPEPLIRQLKPGGRMIVPVGVEYQELVLLIKDGKGRMEKKRLIPVRFVPMTGRIQEE